MFRRSRHLLLASLLLTLAVTSPASAYLRDFELRNSIGTTYSTPNRGSGTPCPAVLGSTPLGGGGHVTPESSGLAINRLWFDFQTRLFNTGVVRVDPPLYRRFQAWRLDAQAFCTAFTTTGPGPAGGPYLRDVEIERAQTVNSSATERIRGVSCFDKKVIAGGWVLTPIRSQTNHVAVDSIRSLANGAVLSVHAYEVDPNPAAWQLVAFAICARVTAVANTTSGYVGNDIRVITSEGGNPPNAADDEAAAVAQCPQGMQIIGGGAEVLGADARHGPPQEVGLYESRPTEPPPGATYPDAWWARGQEDDETTAAWRIRARAICANIT